MILAAAIIAPIVAWAILAGITLHLENRRDDHASADDIPQLRAQLIARGAFPSPPAAELPHPDYTPAAGAVPGRGSPGTSPDVTGENAPAAPHSAADAAAPAGDLSHAIANGGELVTHPDPSVWKGHRNIAPWHDPDSPWADEPGTFTAFITGSGEVA